MPGADNLYEVAISGSLNGQFCQNILHAQVAITTGTPDPFIVAVALGLTISTTWIPKYLDCLPETYLISSVRTRGIQPAATATATTTFSPGSNAGTRAAEFSTYVEGPLLTFPVTLSKPVLGKIFLPGVAEDDIQYGIIEDPLKVAINAFLLILQTTTALSGTVVGGFKYCVTNSAKTDWALPVAGLISPTIGTQRRRARPLF